MSKKRFTIYKEDKFKDEWYAYPFYIKDNGEKITETMPMGTAKEVANLLNSLADDIKHLEEYCGDLESDVKHFEKENEQLKKQVENLQEALAEMCATLLMNGLEIEFNGKNLSELIDDE